MEPHDLDRAVARAAILKRVGYPAEPAVAGARMDGRLLQQAERAGVMVFLHDDDIPPGPDWPWKAADALDSPNVA